MKKSGIFVILAITLAVILTTAGVYLIKNAPHSPAHMETVPPASATGGPIAPVNINTASHAELMTLPGIGEVLAFQIIAYRQVHGHFQTVTELTQVEGIGEKILQDILPYITVGG